MMAYSHCMSLLYFFLLGRASFGAGPVDGGEDAFLFYELLERCIATVSLSHTSSFCCYSPLFCSLFPELFGFTFCVLSRKYYGSSDQRSLPRSLSLSTCLITFSFRAGG
jgi:hypothetical protein